MSSVVLPATKTRQTFVQKTLRGTVPPVWETSTTTYDALLRQSRTVWRTANWAQVRRTTAPLPMYSYSASLYGNYQFSDGSVSYTQGTSPKRTYSYVGHLGCYPGGASMMPTQHASQAAIATDLQAKLTSCLLNKVRAQKYSVPETMVESKKTLKMILGIVADVTGAMKDVKAGRFMKAAHRLGLKQVPNRAGKYRRFSDNWLEYRYGWGPLYQTVYGAMTHLYDGLKGKDQLVRVQCDAGPVDLPLDIQYGAWGYGTPTSLAVVGCEWRQKKSHRRTTQVKGVLYFWVHNPGLTATSQMGLTNPALVAWELLPLSFVADWFVNVSDVLAQLDAWVGKSYAGGTWTITHRDELRVTCEVRDTVSTNDSWQFSSPNYGADGVFVTRQLINTPPSVLPRIRADLNFKRLLDGVALMKQRAS